MTEYGRYCPVAVATEVVADRWTPLVVRELILGNTHFNDIARAMPGISRSLLVQRLRHLERAGVLERWPAPTGRGTVYVLTPAGRDLERVIDALARWAIEWHFEHLEPREVDAQTLMWWIHRRIAPERFPPVRAVIEWQHTAPIPQAIWYVIERGAISVCVQHPGFDVDVVVRMSTGDLADVFHGTTSWAEAIGEGRIVATGAPRLVSVLPTWFRWSPWAEPTRERAQRISGA